MKAALILLFLGMGAARAQDVKPDEREDFEADAYLGLSVDAFTAQAQRDVIYGNPQDNGTKRERMIGGFNFAYRLFGSSTNTKRPQIWLYGQTLHGVRSSEVDCKAAADVRPPVCAISDNVFNKTPQDPTKQLVYLLRNASSLEAHAGLRFEFLPLNASGNNPARLYFKAEAGFLSIAQSGGDVFDVHHIGVGALSTGGRFPPGDASRGATLNWAMGAMTCSVSTATGAASWTAC